MLIRLLSFIVVLLLISGCKMVNTTTVKATAIVDIFGRILPTIANGRLNLAALVLIILLRLLGIMGNQYLNGIPASTPPFLLAQTLLTLIEDFLRFCRYIIFGSIILSWVTVFTNARSPFIDVIWQLAEPLLAPFRRIIPNTGPLDFSPILALLSIYIIEQLMHQATITLLTSIS